MKHSESLKAIAPALLRAQKKIHGVVPNQKNTFFKSEYANLEACWGAVKDALHAEGISLIQTMGFVAGGGPTLNTTLLHESGEYISGEQPVCAKDADPQAMGSAISYARRYGLSAIVSLVEVDDDGEGAMKRPPAPPEGNAAPKDAQVKQFPQKKIHEPCGKPMMLSKYPNKVTGNIDFYCTTCKVSVPQ